MSDEWGRGKAHTGLWGNLRERAHLKDLGVAGRIILNWILRLQDDGLGQDSSSSSSNSLCTDNSAFH
jgi:hypothetical protein